VISTQFENWVTATCKTFYVRYWLHPLLHVLLMLMETLKGMSEFGFRYEIL
jgi:hypothetical protein